MATRAELIQTRRRATGRYSIDEVKREKVEKDGDCAGILTIATATRSVRARERTAQRLTESRKGERKRKAIFEFDQRRKKLDHKIALFQFQFYASVALTDAF